MRYMCAIPRTNICAVVLNAMRAHVLCAYNVCTSTIHTVVLYVCNVYTVYTGTRSTIVPYVGGKYTGALYTVALYVFVFYASTRVRCGSSDAKNHYFRKRHKI